MIEKRTEELSPGKSLLAESYKDDGGTSVTTEPNQLAHRHVTPGERDLLTRSLVGQQLIVWSSQDESKDLLCHSHHMERRQTAVTGRLSDRRSDSSSISSLRARARHDTVSTGLICHSFGLTAHSFSFPFLAVSSSGQILWP